MITPWHVTGVERETMSDTRSTGFTSVSVPDGYVRYMLPQLFEPCAVELVSKIGLHPGQSVLDVASGLGPVARLAAAAVGPTGRVVAPMTEPDVNKHYPAAVAGAHTAGSARPLG